MKTKIDFFPIQVIQSEVICAANAINGSGTYLVHARVNPNGQLTITAKGTSKDTIDYLFKSVLPQNLINAWITYWTY